MLTSIRYVLICALRDRLFIGLIAAIAFIAIIAGMLGQTSVVEEKEMALAYAGGAGRYVLAIGLTVFICFHIRSAFDTREIDVMLSRPLSRAQLAVSYWLGFAVVATLLTLPLMLALVIVGPPMWPGFFVFSASLLLETWLVVSLALFAALILRSAVSSVMATLGFYMLSRLMAYFLMSADFIPAATPMLIFGKHVLTAVSMLVPRLDFFGKTTWLVYGVESAAQWQHFVVQAAIFIPLLIAACVLDFRRKQF